MSLDIKYSDSLEEGECCYHDFSYISDQKNDKHSETVFGITNEIGNEIVIEFEHEGKEYRVPTNKVRIILDGGIENADFLRALRMILEAEKISKIFKE
jgi:hypothetical protein